MSITDRKGRILIPGQWVVVAGAPDTSLVPNGSLWRLENTDDPHVAVLEGCDHPLHPNQLEYVDFYSVADFYIGDVVLNLTESPGHPRGFYKVTGFRYSDCAYVVTDKDTIGRMSGRYRAVPDDADEEGVGSRALWLAYDQACELVKMHPSAHPLHVEITALRHNLLDALLRLLEV